MVKKRAFVSDSDESVESLIRSLTSESIDEILDDLMQINTDDATFFLPWGMLVALFLMAKKVKQQNLDVDDVLHDLLIRSTAANRMH